MVGRIPLEDVILVRVQVWQLCTENIFYDPHSLAGRTHPSGGCYLGSSPGLAALYRKYFYDPHSLAGRTHPSGGKQAKPLKTVRLSKRSEASSEIPGSAANS